MREEEEEVRWKGALLDLWRGLKLLLGLWRGRGGLEEEGETPGLWFLLVGEREGLGVGDLEEEVGEWEGLLEGEVEGEEVGERWTAGVGERLSIKFPVVGERLNVVDVVGVVVGVVVVVVVAVGGLGDSSEDFEREAAPFRK